MIKVAKLVTGEFVIGNMMDLNLTNVMLIRFTVDQRTGIVTKTLLPYMTPISNSLGKVITSDKIITFEDAPKEIQVLYLQSMQEIISNVKGDNDLGNVKTAETSRPNGIHGEDQTPATEVEG